MAKVYDTFAAAEDRRSRCASTALVVACQVDYVVRKKGEIRFEIYFSSREAAEEHIAAAEDPTLTIDTRIK